MKRRDFIAGAAAGLALSTLSGSAASRVDPPGDKPPPGRMRLGCQSGPADDQHLAFLKRHGVEGVCAAPGAPRNRRVWSIEELAALRERVERHGLSLDMVPTPFLESSHVDHNPRAAIVLGQSPERDRDIEDFQFLPGHHQRDAGAAGRADL